MNTALLITSCVLALAWLPLVRRFRLGWQHRRNPVSLAICAALLLFTYTNILFAFALTDQVDWQFFGVATHVFDVVVIVNFYVSFRWSDRRFPEARRGYSVPPTNSASTPRGS